ncbi:MAG TPA: site-2 protease family protein [Solirubrobacteraceae bacterium]|nr:site-2 protease family protein [Solirubrobacteraceae bacterium]
MSWALTIFGIMLLILLHELGHFLVAKRVGMRVERFAVFFPPLIVKRRLGETEYGIGALPFGGYVKITGMNPDEIKGLPPELAKRAYYNQPPWKRIAVILAGPGVNILIAFVIFWAVLVAGNQSGAEALARFDPSAQTLVGTTGVAGVIKGLPAAKEIRPGERIVAIDGHPATVESVRKAVDATKCPGGAKHTGCRATSAVNVKVRAPSGATRTVRIYPRYSEGRMLIGVDFATAPKSFGVFAAAGTAVAEMWRATTSTVSGLGEALTSSKKRKELHSIIGITEYAHATVVSGTGVALVFLGFISLVLAVINLFPFLPLDGGHVAWALAEKIRGRRVSLAAMVRFSSVGIVLLLFLVVNGFANDISRLTG